MASLTMADVEEALARWNLSNDPSLDDALKDVEELSAEVVGWTVVSPDQIPKKGGWGEGVTALVLGAGTVGTKLSSLAEYGDPWLKAMTVAMLGKGQDRFFKIVEAVGRLRLEPIGAFHTPGSAGEMDLSVNSIIGSLLDVRSIGIEVQQDGGLSPSYSWIGIVPLGEGAEKVSFLCHRCPYSESCPLRRE